jgi:UDP-N-acetylmuramate dehydrogenase
MTSAPLIDVLRARLEGNVEADVTLARFTTYRLGGPARLYVEPANRHDVEVLGETLVELPDAPPLLALGRGSNLVVSDDGWPGLVVRLGAGFSFVTDTETGLRAGGVTALPLLANRAARRDLTGMEFAIAIPGSVGGAVRMNAGAHGRAIKDCLIAADIYDFGTGRATTRDPSSLQLSYRHSNVTDQQVVLEAAFALEPAPPPLVKDRMESYRKHRAETQPGALSNAGSVFRNPPGDRAGRLVEATGLKGFRVGGASVSELHANFFIAGDGASAQDVFDLVGEVRARVAAAHGIDLVPEIRFVGAFEEHAGDMGSR